MRKTTVKNIIHLLIISLPILLLLIACIFPTKKVVNNYALESETNVNTLNEYYYYDIDTKKIINTNEVNNINDLVEGNVYTFTATNINVDLFFNSMSLPVSYNLDFDVLDCYINASTPTMTVRKGDYYYKHNNNDCLFSVLKYQSGDTYYLGFAVQDTFINNQNTQGVYYYIMKPLDTTFSIKLSSVYLPNGARNDFLKIFINNFDNENINITSFENIENYKHTTNNITTINNYNTNTLIETQELKEPNQAILKPFKEFYQLNINSWYSDVLNLIGIDLTDNIVKEYIIYYPLWLMWFYLFELVEIILTFVPRVLMHLTRKIGGGSDV